MQQHTPTGPTAFSTGGPNFHKTQPKKCRPASPRAFPPIKPLPGPSKPCGPRRPLPPMLGPNCKGFPSPGRGGPRTPGLRRKGMCMSLSSEGIDRHLKALIWVMLDVMHGVSLPKFNALRSLGITFLDTCKGRQRYHFALLHQTVTQGRFVLPMQRGCAGLFVQMKEVTICYQFMLAANRAWNLQLQKWFTPPNSPNAGIMPP
eukprot:1152670-Pelagomonas_calceolata.AAC.2